MDSEITRSDQGYYTTLLILFNLCFPVSWLRLRRGNRSHWTGCLSDVFIAVINWPVKLHRDLSPRSERASRGNHATLSSPFVQERGVCNFLFDHVTKLWRINAALMYRHYCITHINAGSRNVLHSLDVQKGTHDSCPSVSFKGRNHLGSILINIV